VWSVNVRKSNTTFNTINAHNSNIPLDERFGLHVVYDTHHWLFEVDLILLHKGTSKGIIIYMKLCISYQINMSTLYLHFAPNPNTHD
jgi:hypothetical protein